MKLLVFSDLHMDLRPEWSMPKEATVYDVAVIAGDVGGSPLAAMRGLSKEPGLAGKPIVYVAGNHEFYGGDIDARLKEARTVDHPRIHLLDRSQVVIDGVRFVGATLWSAHDVGDRREAENTMNDHRLIESFFVEDAITRHRLELAAVEAMLAEPFDGLTVVVTHHAPSHRSTHRKHRSSKITGAFASNCEPTIRRYTPTLWIHGHVHDSFDYRIANTRILCNPKGYGPDKTREQENANFDPRLIVEI